jgi:hypothetical protein
LPSTTVSPATTLPVTTVPASTTTANPLIELSVTGTPGSCLDQLVVIAAEGSLSTSTEGQGICTPVPWTEHLLDSVARQGICTPVPWTEHLLDSVATETL